MNFAPTGYFPRSILASCLLVGMLGFGMPATAQVLPQVPQIPAFLPMFDSVAPTPPQPLDGTWLITSIRKKVRIEGGRAYAIDGWVHMMVLKVEPGMVVIQDIVPTAPGKYTGNDLPLMGTWDARVEADRSIAVTVKTALMPISYKLVPMQLDNPQWYAQEMQAAGLSVPRNDPAPRAPGYQPAPPAYQPPPPGYQPAPPGYRPPPPAAPPPSPRSESPAPSQLATAQNAGGQPVTNVAVPAQYAPSGALQLRFAEPPAAGSDAPRAMTRARGAKRAASTERLCPDKGAEGEELCLKMPAIDHGKFNLLCKGGQLYLSDGNCYRCPEGYKRSNITRKMAGDPEACEKRGFNTQAYKRATLERDAFGCEPGQFQHKTRCKNCPSGFDRNHVLGIDAGTCDVPRDRQCLGELQPAKQPPDNLLERVGNWAGSRSRKLCAPPFDINLFTIQAVIKVGEPLVFAIGSFTYKMATGDRETKDKVARIKADIKARRLKQALAGIKTFDEFPRLVKAAQAAGMFSLTFGFGVDASAFAGINYEIGLAVDVASLVDGGEPKLLKFYQASGLSKGISLSADGGFVVGAWGGRIESEYSQGYVAAAGNIPLPPPLPPAAIGIGVWTTYYTPEEGQPRLLGFTANFGMGAGFELAEYNEVYTKVGD